MWNLKKLRIAPNIRQFKINPITTITILGIAYVSEADSFSIIGCMQTNPMVILKAVIKMV